jgi:hypothetical protein
MPTFCRFMLISALLWAIAHIQANFPLKLTVPELAKRSHLSTFHFSRLLPDWLAYRRANISCNTDLWWRKSCYPSRIQICLLLMSRRILDSQIRLNSVAISAATMGARLMIIADTSSHI